MAEGRGRLKEQRGGSEGVGVERTPAFINYYN